MKNIEILTGNVPRFLLIVFFVLPGVSLFSLDVSGTQWSSESRPELGYPEAIKIGFSADQHFYIGVQETHVEGTYSQTGNDIILNYTNVYNQRYAKGVGNKLSIVETNNLFYRYKLVCSGGWKFFNRYSPPQGEKREIDGIVVYVYNANGTVNENARMREGPGLQYKNARIYQGEIIVSKGEGVTVFGQSENQTTIDGVTAYWYYCGWISAWSDWNGVYGWTWGGLIDFK